MGRYDNDVVRRGDSAFTLVELLLVVLIIGMATAIAVPSFVSSMKGIRLRSSARQVIMANRYARNMAVLKQQQMVLHYRVEEGRLELNPVQAASSSASSGDSFDASSLFGAPGDGAPGLDENGDPRPPATGTASLSRKLREGISFDDFVGIDSQQDDTGFWINYYPNGMCDAHRFRLVDQDERESGNGLSAEIKIEGLTGEIAMEFKE